MKPWLRPVRDENDREDVESDEDGNVTLNRLQRPEVDTTPTPPADKITDGPFFPEL